jgi:acyl carrier protein
MERQEIIDGLIEILKTVRTIDPAKLVGVTEETDFLKDLNTPSTELINIAAKVEHKFGIEFDDDDIDNMGSKVKDIVDLIVTVQAREENE